MIDLLYFILVTLTVISVRFFHINYKCNVASAIGAMIFSMCIKHNIVTVYMKLASASIALHPMYFFTCTIVILTETFCTNRGCGFFQISL